MWALPCPASGLPLPSQPPLVCSLSPSLSPAGFWPQTTNSCSSFKRRGVYSRMLVRWLTGFLGRTRQQAHALWSRERGQATRWDCSSRNHRGSARRSGRGWREKPPARCLLPPCGHQPGLGGSPAHLCLQVRLVESSRHLCSPDARPRRDVAFPIFPPPGI